MSVSYNYVEQYKGEDVKGDPNLKACEKDVFIHLWPLEKENGNKGNAIVVANKTSIVRGLINHNEAKIKTLRKYNGNIVGGIFYIPIGLVKVKKYSRNKNHLSRVVSY